jgi:hypothetical protein
MAYEYGKLQRVQDTREGAIPGLIIQVAGGRRIWNLGAVWFQGGPIHDGGGIYDDAGKIIDVAIYALDLASANGWEWIPHTDHLANAWPTVRRKVAD